MKDFRLALLVSGEGSTGEVLFDKATLVVVSNPQAGIIERIRKYNKEHNHRLNFELVSRAAFRDRAEFGQALFKVLKKYQINFISQNGWTVYTPENVLSGYRGKIINSHPGPLDPGYPDFGGAKMNNLLVHQAVIYFASHISRPFKTEVCLHQVSREFDKGELVAFREVDILKEDSPESLQQRVKDVERELLRDFWSEVEKTGEIKTIQRKDRVIKASEEPILEQAKKQAIEKYG